MKSREVELEAGLRFFSTMIAANSHEIKNTLAIINENAGLLADLVMMAARGRPLDPERLDRIAAKIRQQVARGDQLSKSSNQLAHSIDDRRGPTDLVSALQLALSLANRFAVSAQVEIEVAPGPEELYLPVPTFQVLNLVWLVLESLLERVSPGARVILGVEKTADGGNLRMAAQGSDPPPAAGAWAPAAELDALAAALAGDIAVDPQNGDVVLAFKKQARTLNSTARG